MLSHNDPQYLATKRIKQALDTLDPLMNDLADWLLIKYDVRPLNIILSVLPDGSTPRLDIIFEFHEQMVRFGVNFPIAGRTQKDEERICRYFVWLLETQRRSREFNEHPEQFPLQEQFATLNFKRLFVSTSAFAPLALCEANRSIPQELIDALMKRINCPEIIDAFRHNAAAYFVVQRDAERDWFKSINKEREWGQLYLELLKPRDEFNYINPDTFRIHIESQQTIDEKYDGKWYWYF